MLKFYQRYRHTITKAVANLTTYGIEPNVQQRLATFLLSSDLRMLYRANPRMIAEQLELNEHSALHVLVTALKEGIVTLNWEIECPKCRGIDFSPQSLLDLRTQHICPGCACVHLTDVDSLVRVTFSIDERLRRLPEDADDEDFRAKIDASYGFVSGHRLLTVQTFRNLFPRETIPPNESLIVRKVAILFTDLAGSTAMYSRSGDSRAYSLIRQHFNLLFAIVDSQNGAVVKTIGDAIMAAFTNPTDAFDAAIAMQKQIYNLNQRLKLPEGDNLILKIGIDAGPCISVSLNERPDYFGMTVNTAARVQALSQGNDIVITDTVLDSLRVSAEEKFRICEQNQVLLKGLDIPIVTYYIQPS